MEPVLIKIYKYPERSEWRTLLRRPAFDTSSFEASVTNIINEVKAHGDEAVKKFTSMFDKVSLQNLAVSRQEIEEGARLVNDDLKKAISQARENIDAFHSSQIHVEQPIETVPGVVCWRKSVPIDKVGLYIPGGSAPLFSTILMLGIPARIAGCQEIILCSPAGKDGKLHPAILYTASLLGIEKIYKVGGAQAIAAMASGTETIPQVYKIFGPGNQYVTSAKQLVQKEGVAIDMPAGPSEVAVLADETADPRFVAADLLSQAEHGEDSQVILVTTSEDLANKVANEVLNQIPQLSRKETAKKALQHSKIIITANIEEGVDLINHYAPEHLIIACSDEQIIVEKIANAGSIFLGNYSPESAGDYASGTNHTLPTNGYARAYSGVSVDSFVKKITYQKLSKVGLQNISSAVQLMAEAEGLDAHLRAVSIRLV